MWGYHRNYGSITELCTMIDTLEIVPENYDRNAIVPISIQLHFLIDAVSEVSEVLPRGLSDCNSNGTNIRVASGPTARPTVILLRRLF